MAVRPRYTARMKARDALAAARVICAALAPVAAATARVVGPVIVASARHLATARYTDPGEPRMTTLYRTELDKEIER